MKLNDILTLLLPLLIIPITFYSVSTFGHMAGNAVIGIAYFVCLVKFTKDTNEKRLMIMLSIFITLFEKVSVAIGSYSYIGLTDVPMWISLGWSIVALYLLRNVPLFKKVDRKYVYVLASIFYLLIWAYSGFKLDLLMPSMFAVLGIYVVSSASKLPEAFFLATSFIGIVLEYFGTSFKLWTYFNPDGSTMAAPLAALGLGYISAIIFGIWISHVE